MWMFYCSFYPELVKKKKKPCIPPWAFVLAGKGRVEIPKIKKKETKHGKQPREQARWELAQHLVYVDLGHEAHWEILGYSWVLEPGFW